MVHESLTGKPEQGPRTAAGVGSAARAPAGTASAAAAGAVVAVRFRDGHGRERRLHTSHSGEETAFRCYTVGFHSLPSNPFFLT